MLESHKVIQLGIWMDHSMAHLIEYSANEHSHQHIKSDIESSDKSNDVYKGENHLHNKEHQLMESFYKKIADKILNFNHVLLFGPTDAKVELHNMLKKDTHFNSIYIVVESAGKMTENEKTAYVKNYFEKAIFPNV
jgi:hypothetical protein